MSRIPPGKMPVPEEVAAAMDRPPLIPAQGPGTTFMGHPRGLFLLFMVEMWERFSYYGMRGLLVLYLTAALATHQLAPGIYRNTLEIEQTPAPTKEQEAAKQEPPTIRARVPLAAVVGQQGAAGGAVEWSVGRVTTDAKGERVTSWGPGGDAGPLKIERVTASGTKDEHGNPQWTAS